MMALNVGIEAARSGEGGKQFTILAGDMRVLAERVLAETRQIQTALQNVHAQIDQVLQSSASGQVLTEESAKKITAMAETFDELYTLVEETESAAGQITEDTLAQLDAVRRLVSAAAKVKA
jgi:twitching motility protein PilJ